VDDALVTEIESNLQAVKNKLLQDLKVRRQQLDELRRVFGVSK
jgi:hypothetical protein